MPLTLISHFWNEEFLLPYWLRHHYPLFDRGILIDYGSTDRSLDIIRELAPRWEVRPTVNAWFDARDIDAEVMAVEREIAGWKVVLNTTEFLLSHDLGLFIRWLEKYRPDLRGIWPFDLAIVDPLPQCDAEVTDAPLYFQRHWGYHPRGGRSRLLHCHPDGRYAAGRHSSDWLRKDVDDSLFIVWFGWSPMRYVRGRKLQIQKRISARDRAEGLGRQHLLSAESLEANYRKEAAHAYDLLAAHAPYRQLLQSLACQTAHTLPTVTARTAP
jgi:hypothetical protein